MNYTVREISNDINGCINRDILFSSTDKNEAIKYFEQINGFQELFIEKDYKLCKGFNEYALFDEGEFYDEPEGSRLVIRGKWSVVVIDCPLLEIPGVKMEENGKKISYYGYVVEFSDEKF